MTTKLNSQAQPAYPQAKQSLVYSKEAVSVHLIKSINDFYTQRWQKIYTNIHSEVWFE